MSDRGAFGRMFGADFEQIFNTVLQDATQLGLAISQITAERKVRIMGALAGSGTENRERNLNMASMVYDLGEMFRKSHYMEIFVKANLHIMRYVKNRDYAKLAKLKGQLVYFYVTYETLTTIMEGALERFDLYFDQWHVLTTMGLRPPERREGEATWMAADETALETARLEQQKAKEDWRKEIPESIDDFATAFKKARIIAEGFDELGHKDISLPDIETLETLNKKLKDLTEELASLKKKKKDTTVTADAGT